MSIDPKSPLSVAPATETTTRLHVVPMAHYEGAGQGRRLAGWKAPSTGPVQAVAPALPTLRNRARDAARNAPLAAAIVRAWLSALVGSGIVCRTQTDDAKQREKIESAWRNWLPQADATGAAADFYALQSLAVRAFIESGECYLRFRSRRLSDGLAAPVQIELLESDMLPQLDLQLANGNRIVQGIEFDRLGRRVAYHFHRAHPGDKAAFSVDLSSYSRVPAEFVSHVFLPERPGQVRGVSVLAPILTRLRILDDFTDAASERAKLANLFAMFVRRPMPTDAQANIDPLTGKTIQFDDQGAPMAALEPGISQELLPGEEVTFSDPPQPGAEFAEFVRSQIAQIAAGAGGIPTEFLTGDLRDVTDRALRVSLNEWRRVCESVQWQVVIPRVCIPVRAAWAQAAMLAGHLSTADAMAANVCEWTPPRHRHLHPVQDVQGLRLEVEAGFRSRASVVAEYGYDVADVDSERSYDAAREKSLGLQSDAERLAQAEIDRLEAEAAAADATAKAARERAAEAKANAEALRATKATTEALRTHEIAAASDRAKVARLEVEAARVGLAELRGSAK
nr:phage portal protein [Dechloromonas sp.]